jgi:hypothetical protein
MNTGEFVTARLKFAAFVWTINMFKVGRIVDCVQINKMRNSLGSFEDGLKTGLKKARFLHIVSINCVGAAQKCQ